MSWLQIIQVLWPIAVILTPLVTGAGFLWLKTQFPTKTELTTTQSELKLIETSIHSKLEEIETANRERFERGSRKFADQDKRLALLEDEAERMPSRETLQSELSELSQRLRGVEVGFEGMNRRLETTNTYLHTIIDKGLGK